MVPHTHAAVLAWYAWPFVPVYKLSSLRQARAGEGELSKLQYGGVNLPHLRPQSFSHGGGRLQFLQEAQVPA